MAHDRYRRRVREPYTGPIPGIAAKLESREQLSEEEFAQYMLFIWAMLTHHRQIFYQCQHGMIDNEVFEAYKVRLHAILGTSLSSAVELTVVDQQAY